MTFSLPVCSTVLHVAGHSEDAGKPKEIVMKKMVRAGLLWAAIAALMVFSSGVASASTGWG
jgi:hypothetical protein